MTMFIKLRNRLKTVSIKIISNSVSLTSLELKTFTCQRSFSRNKKDNIDKTFANDVSDIRLIS